MRLPSKGLHCMGLSGPGPSRIAGIWLEIKIKVSAWARPCRPEREIKISVWIRPEIKYKILARAVFFLLLFIYFFLFLFFFYPPKLIFIKSEKKIYILRLFSFSNNVGKINVILHFSYGCSDIRSNICLLLENLYFL